MKKTLIILALMAIATLMLASCWKMYFADRPPKKWNNDFVTPTSIYDNRNTIAMGDTVMAVGWLFDTIYDGDSFGISTDSGYVSNGIAADMHRGALCIRTAMLLPYLSRDLYYDFPALPCKVYVTGRFYHIASECHCDWAYCLVPTREEDVVFEPINNFK